MHEHIHGGDNFSYFSFMFQMFLYIIIIKEWCTLSLLVVVQYLSLGDPFHVALQVLIQLLGLSEHLVFSTRLSLLSLLGELTDVC